MAAPSSAVSPWGWRSIAISDTYKGAAPVAIAGAAAFVVMVAVELRRLPQQAPVHGLVARSCLAGAALAAVTSLVVSSSWTGWMVLLAATLGTAGCVAPVPQKRMYDQLIGVAAIGGGVAGIGLGIAAMLRSELLIGVVGIGLGVVLIGFGTALLLSSQLLGGIVLIGLGVAGIGFGIAALLSSQLLGGVVLIGLGVAGIGFGIAALLSSQLLPGVVLIGLGLTAIGYGTVSVQRTTNLLARLRALTADPGDPDSRSPNQ